MDGATTCWEENTKRRSLVQYEDEEFEVLEGHPSTDGRLGKL